MLYSYVGQVGQVEFLLSKGGSLNELGDGIVEALAASEEFRRSSNHYLVAGAACVVGRHLWFTGVDDEEAIAWTETVAAHWEKVGNRHQRTIFKIPLLLREVFAGTPSAAADIYLNMAEQLQPPIPLFLDFGTLMPHLIMLSLMMLFPAKYGTTFGTENKYAEAAKLEFSKTFARLQTWMNFQTRL
ncbi:hypothetical protein HK101_010046 [Irineochytrium annulatum]|nr:hypothetical protein HK101_010046 [Irineochytrium annulatum]